MNQAYEISHLLSGGMLVTSFALLYQERIAAVLNAFAAQSIILALAVAWAAWSGDRPDLYITALIAFTLKGAYTVETPIDLDLGLDGLGLDVDANLKLAVGFRFDVGFGVSADDGFYLHTGKPGSATVGLARSCWYAAPTRSVPQLPKA